MTSDYSSHTPKNPLFHIAYCKFKIFTYQKMLKITNKKTGYWPGIFMRKNLDLIIKLCFQKEVEKRYSRKVQLLYRTTLFGLATKSQSYPQKIDHCLLQNIINEAKNNAPHLSSMMMTVTPFSR